MPRGKNREKTDTAAQVTNTDDSIFASCGGSSLFCYDHVGPVPEHGRAIYSGQSRIFYKLSGKKLYREENEWVNAYVVSRLTIRDVTGKFYINNTETSPYDALSRLVTDTNSPEMKAYYELFSLDQAQLSDTTNVTNEEVNAWQQERKEYVQKALLADRFRSYAF